MIGKRLGPYEITGQPDDGETRGSGAGDPGIP